MHNNKNTFVLFHANCFDGTGAKYAAWKKFKDNATYIPVQYGSPFPKEVNLTPETTIYILDFSYPRETLLEIEAQVQELIVLDHHETAQQALADLPFAKFDMSKSGAVLAWEYFFPSREVPMILQYVQDRDLWKWKLDNTKKVTEALPLLQGDMELWDQLRDSWALSELIDIGDHLIVYNQLKINSALKSIKILPYQGYKIGVANTTTLTSEIGNAVCLSPDLGVDFSLTYFVSTNAEAVLSFRSVGDMNVATLAKQLGGGGHKNAAGAKVGLDFLKDLYAGTL